MTSVIDTAVYRSLALGIGLGVLMLTLPTHAQTPATIKVRYDKATITWNWVRGTTGLYTGDALGFKVKCGATAGLYTITKQIDTPATRSILVAQVVTTVGTYFCTVVAFNSYGDSNPSNEINFDAGEVPAAATGTSLVNQ